VLDSIPSSERAENVTDLDLNFDDLPIERALGIEWNVVSDSFQFRLVLSKKPFTRRGILSTVASVYDPLGCLSPFVLLGKQILQQMCKENTAWDEPLSEELKPKWEQWLIELSTLVNIKIARCIKPAEFGTVIHRELHHFSDASTKGYGQCSYLRIVNEQGMTHCAFVMGKSRVTPLKVVTIPRLELTAALVSVRISQLLRYELGYESVEEYFWTDSKVVLGYIHNDARRFHIFVANRVQQIKEATKAQQWRYVDSKVNPADHASRGLHVTELGNSNWFNGPEFLWDPELPPAEPVDLKLVAGDPEVKKHIVHTVQNECDEGISILKRLEQFSNWSRIVNIIALLKRFLLFKGKVISDMRPVLEEDRQRAKYFIITLVQKEAFPDSLKALRQKTKISKGQDTGKLYKLDPFLDNDGILRVGGRIEQAIIAFEEKHPIILPKYGHITTLIIRHHHEKVLHQGRGMTINELRSNGYWIIGCSHVVSSLIYKCVICRKLRGRNQDQKMANLPVDRLQPVPPFTYCGMDCFGPFYVKEGRKELKKYGLLLTCMTCRAIHLEMLDDMSTDALINGIRCFVALRGPVRQIRCDHGSNFIGAERALQEAFKEIREDDVRKFLAKNHCDFVMNSPASSHMGGVWERQIRTTRSILNTLLNHHKARLDSSSLRTFLYEAMAIVNSRPLSVDNLADPHGPSPISPNHLLTMKSKVILPPPGKFESNDIYARKRWRQVQYLADQFWSRWKREYILQLQERQKWMSKKRNMAIGDIVIIKDEDLFRGNWKLGKVVEIMVDLDGLVRKVKVLVADPTILKKGQWTNKSTILERPVHKLVLLLESSLSK
jgi:hypothetical protein